MSDDPDPIEQARRVLSPAAFAYLTAGDDDDWDEAAAAELVAKGYATPTHIEFTPLGMAVAAAHPCDDGDEDD